MVPIGLYRLVDSELIVIIYLTGCQPWSVAIHLIDTPRTCAKALRYSKLIRKLFETYSKFVRAHSNDLRTIFERSSNDLRTNPKGNLYFLKSKVWLSVFFELAGPNGIFAKHLSGDLIKIIQVLIPILFLFQA